jgi:hypothetical protein
LQPEVVGYDWSHILEVCNREGGARRSDHSRRVDRGGNADTGAAVSRVDGGDDSPSLDLQREDTTQSVHVCLFHELLPEYRPRSGEAGIHTRRKTSSPHCARKDVERSSELIDRSAIPQHLDQRGDDWSWGERLAKNTGLALTVQARQAESSAEKETIAHRIGAGRG